MSSGFWINFNPAANNVLNNLGNVNQQINQESQIMSSGNLVNSAADNPAAYAISQNMQMESNGLNVAVQNAQQGTAMLQTATGAQQQILGILQTMNQLSTQAAQNGTQSVSDRAGLQLEMNSLAQEINSITNQTQYNGLNVLSGMFSSGATGSSTVTLQVGANEGQTISFNMDSTDAVSLGVAGVGANSSTGYASGTLSATGVTVAASGNVVKIEGAANTLLETGSYRIVFQGSYANTGTSTATTGTGNLSGTLQLQIADGSGWDNVGTSVGVTSGSTGDITLGDIGTGATLSVSLTAGYLTGTIAVTSGAYVTGTAAQTDSFTLSGTASTSGTLANDWTSSSQVVGLNILTASSAADAITKVQAAISTVTAQEEQLGAVQNRLNYTVTDLQNTSSNLSTANNVIVGANMAKEQSMFAQSQILEQAGISVLSQVNQQPALLLKLLG